MNRTLLTSGRTYRLARRRRPFNPIRQLQLFWRRTRTA